VRRMLAPDLVGLPDMWSRGSALVRFALRLSGGGIALAGKKSTATVQFLDLPADEGSSSIVLDCVAMTCSF
jgi:hypothetical protein